jgi:signal transduction histidine kinase
MPGVSQKKFYAIIQDPSADALDLLAPHTRQIVHAWKQKLAPAGACLDPILSATPVDFGQFATALRECSYATFRRRMHELGRDFAHRGVSLDCTVTALNRLYESCLAVLRGRSPHTAAPLLALTRLHAVIAVLMVGGYAGESTTAGETAAQTNPDRTGAPRPAASAYVTRVYEQERRRLSRDLHDDVGHDLMLIKLYLEMMLLETNGHGDVPPRLTETIGLVSHAIDAVRRLILDLGPAVFENLGFIPAVRSYISQFSARTNIDIALLEGDIPPDIPSALQVALYRVLQGALSNVFKHSSADRVRVSLGSGEGSVLCMKIEDNGIGFDVTPEMISRSFGLTAMRERVEVLGGSFHIHSTLAGPRAGTHGTTIEVDLPLAGVEKKGATSRKRKSQS